MFGETKVLKEILRELELILKELRKNCAEEVKSFKIIGDKMDINPSQSTTLTAVPLDSTRAPTTLPAGDVPNWSASDTSQITATPSADGLSLTIAVSPTATAETIVFTVTDAIITTATGTFSLTITPAVSTVNPVASFAVTASTPA